MFRVIVPGHKYALKERSEQGITDSEVELKFIKIAEDGVNDTGVFTQDVLEVLVDRVEWQIEQRSLPLIAELERMLAAHHMRLALQAFAKFTATRKLLNIPTPGHLE